MYDDNRNALYDTTATEGKLTAWALLALVLVVLGIMIGGCA